MVLQALEAEFTQMLLSYFKKVEDKQIIVEDVKCAEQLVYQHSPQITFPPCVTKPSSLTLISMTVPFVMTPSEV